MEHSSSIREYLHRGPLSARELALLLYVSQPTLSRALARMPEIIAMGRARATRYGLAQALPALPAQAHTVHRVGRDGQLRAIGRIAAIVGAGFWYEDLEAPARSRAFDSLPWFLQDMRPQGYLGRATVRDFAARGWPARLELWSERQVLAALILSPAHDHVGNLLIGTHSAEAFRRARQSPVRAALRAEPALRALRYRQAADHMGAGFPGGTSVNGEQPKFPAEVEQADSPMPRAVLVKFTPPLATEAGRRWADLLRMEALALRLIREQLGIPAAQAQWLSCGERAYLEVERFDRLPDGGRLGVISLSSLDAEYTGLGSGWAAVGAALADAGQLQTEAVTTLQALELFGILIGNNDRHLGNASALFDGTRPMALTPIYDFLPMRYAPTATDLYSAPLQWLADSLATPALDASARSQLFAVAAGFWRSSAEDEQLSPLMRDISRLNAAALEALRVSG